MRVRNSEVRKRGVRESKDKEEIENKNGGVSERKDERGRGRESERARDRA